VDEGELIQEAVVREVREETSVEAEPLGVVGIWQRKKEGGDIVSITFLMEWLSGEPCPDGQEVLEARFWELEDIESASNIGPTSKVCSLLARQSDLANAILTEVDVPGRSGEGFVLLAREGLSQR